MHHVFARLAGIVAAVISIAVSGGFAAAQTPAAPRPGAPSATRHDGPVPLIDRELFFGNPEITAAQLSPDGRYIAFIKPYKDTRNVWVKKTEEPFESAHLVTADTKRPIPAYFWSRDSKFILYVQDNAGDENYNVYAVNPADAPAAGQDAPPARNLTDAKGARAIILSVPRNSPDTIFVGLNDRDPAWHDVYKVTLSTGTRELVRKNTDKVGAWEFDDEGRLRLAVRTTDGGDTEILEVQPDALKVLYRCTVFESCGVTSFERGGTRVYLQSNKGEANDRIRLVLFDPATRDETVVEVDPLKRVDLASAIFSDRTGALLATTYVDDRRRVYFHDKAFEADYKYLKSRLPDRDLLFPSQTADEQRWIVAASSDTEPGQTYLFDRTSRQLTLQYTIREKLPRSALATMRPVRYTSSDGLEIPAYLTLPVGVAPKNLPALVIPHGGPWGRDTWGYNGMAQFYANRGYAVLQPNFRASTGYGKKFLNAGNGQWGEKMQDDLTWGVKYLVAQGIADPRRVGITGGSYGGYATLAGVAFTPDLYKAAVAIVAPSNLMTLLDSIPPYWESLRRILYARMADPRSPEGKARLVRQSPLSAADKIVTPLLVVQGANDPRVKRAEADQIVIALRDRGYPVEYLVAPDEGHGFAGPVNNMAMFAASEQFLAKHLGARAQESMTPEVAARLKEITVDPKTVTLQKKLDTAAVTVPKPATDLAAGTAKYKATIAAGGQTIAMGITETIKEENGAWVVTETANTPMGDAVDTCTLEKGTLVVRTRTVRQGPVAVELGFADNKATGTISMGAEPKPVDVDLGGALFADGAGAFSVIGTLPLAEGYTAQYRNFDIQKQKVDTKQARVVGAESVTVPAGTYTAWKVELTSAVGDPGTTTLWIDQATRKVVKIGATLPAMNGATLRAELDSGS
jgi:dipeptidyl aminopeptidase/acylaminoacyl peptidase